MLLAIVCGVLAQETSGLGTCVGFIDSQVRSLPCLRIALSACIKAGARAGESPEEM